MSWIFRVCPQGNGMTLHLTGPESHVFPMTFFYNFRILPGPGFCMRLILQGNCKLQRSRSASHDFSSGRVMSGSWAGKCIQLEPRSWAAYPHFTNGKKSWPPNLYQIVYKFEEQHIFGTAWLLHDFFHLAVSWRMKRPVYTARSATWPSGEVYTGRFMFVLSTLERHLTFPFGGQLAHETSGIHS